MKFDVVVTELVRVMGLGVSRDRELFLGHVDADHLPLGSDQLRCDVDVPAGAASQIQYGPPLDFVGDAESASVIFGQHVGVDVGYGLGDMRGRRCRRAAGVGLEVGSSLEGGAVVGGDGGVGGGFVDEHVNFGGRRCNGRRRRGGRRSSMEWTSWRGPNNDDGAGYVELTRRREGLGKPIIARGMNEC